MLNEVKSRLSRYFRGFLSGKSILAIVLLTIGLITITNAQGITMTLGGNDKFTVENSNKEARLVVTDYGSVGIGTSYTNFSPPMANLHVSGDNGMIVVGGASNAGATMSLGSGVRLHFYSRKIAFRAGGVDGNQWDDNTMGVYSTAFGRSTTASGWGSAAIGVETTASGHTSIAMGNHTTASGEYSTAMGSDVTASGRYSTAMGYGTMAQSLISTAIGGYNVGGGNSVNWVDTDPIFEIGISTNPVRPVNAMTVLKNGNVGIGTATPDVKLEILTPSGSGTNLRLYSGSIATHSFYNSDGDNARTVMRDASGNITIALRTDRESYFNGGSVGIGTKSPTATLSVNGEANKPGGGSWAVFSDERSKENVENYTKGLNELLQLRPVSFNYKEEFGWGNNTFVGLSAQEVEQVVPTMVDKINIKGIEDFRQVNPNELTFMLINAVKELKAENEALKVLIESL